MSSHIPYTVEPPNRGHFGTAAFVLSSEVVLFSEVVLYLLNVFNLFFVTCNTLYMNQSNNCDWNAVAVMKEGQIIGHVPFNLSPIISLFLRRDVNKAFARVTGGKVN